MGCPFTGMVFDTDYLKNMTDTECATLHKFISNILSENSVAISFNKINGTPVSYKDATKSLRLIPSGYHPQGTSTIKQSSENIAVFVASSPGWRTIKTRNILSMSVNK